MVSTMTTRNVGRRTAATRGGGTSEQDDREGERSGDQVGTMVLTVERNRREHLIRRFTERGNKTDPRDVKIVSLKQRIQKLEFPQLQQDSPAEEAKTESNVWDDGSEDVNSFGGGNPGFHDDHYDNPFQEELIVLVEEESCPVYDTDNEQEESMPVYDTDIEDVIEEEEGFLDTAYGSRVIRRIGNWSNALSCEVQALIHHIFLAGYGLQQDSPAEETETKSNIWDDGSEYINPFGGGNPLLTKETESEPIIWDIGNEEEEYPFVNEYPSFKKEPIMFVEDESCPVYDTDIEEEELMPVYDTDIEDFIEEEEGFVGKEGFGGE
ncbi:hypothetical protein Tco_1493410 [Tanacetum coccineum]